MPVSGRSDEPTDAMVESLMRDLLGPQVAIIERFNQPVRDEYMEQLRSYVWSALARALKDTERA